MTSNGYTLAHPADLDGETSYTFTCGKIDAGIAVLIGSHAHLIEFPSLLLPPGCEPGSIVSITCARDAEAEKVQAESFWNLQNRIYNQFGLKSPETPVLRLRSVTQTSVTLEWDKLELAQSKLLSLSIWKNGQRLGSITNPSNNTSTKLSGLDLDTEYSFHLVMKTTGGTFSSKIVKVKTHSLNDTSGINVCFGVVLPEEVLDQAKEAVEKLDARWTDKIQIDTTHFVCTMAHNPQQNHGKSAQPNSFPSLEYQRAQQLSIPIVQPTWLLACLSEQKMVPIAAHYLGSQPPNLTSISNGSGPSSTQGRSGKVTNNQSAGSPNKLPQKSNSTPTSPTITRTINGNQGRTRAGSATPGMVSSSIENSRLPTAESGAANLPVITESGDDTNQAVPPQYVKSNDGSVKDVKQSKEERRSSTSSYPSSIDRRRSSIKTPVTDSNNNEQPSIPPSRNPSRISDILNEVVDGPENDGFSPPINNPSHGERIQTQKSVAESLDSKVETNASGSESVYLTPSRFREGNTGGRMNSGGSDDLEDDPFSATSPVALNLSSSYLDEKNSTGGRLPLNLSPATPLRKLQSESPASSSSAQVASENNEKKELAEAYKDNNLLRGEDDEKSVVMKEENLNEKFEEVTISNGGNLTPKTNLESKDGVVELVGGDKGSDYKNLMSRDSETDKVEKGKESEAADVEMNSPNSQDSVGNNRSMEDVAL